MTCMLTSFSYLEEAVLGHHLVAGMFIGTQDIIGNLGQRAKDVHGKSPLFSVSGELRWYLGACLL